MTAAIDMMPRKLPGGEFSHTGSWAFLRANQLKHVGIDAKVLGEDGRGIKTDWSEFDVVYLYHTLDFEPNHPYVLNVFDGPQEHTAKYFERLIWPQHDHVKMISLDYPMPNYGYRCKRKRDRASETTKMSDYWKNVDWDKVQAKCDSITDWVLDPGVDLNGSDLWRAATDRNSAAKPIHRWKRLIIGDSHAHSAYVAESIVLRKDGRTLRGILKKTIQKEVTDFGYDWDQVDELVCYWGNIDVRHHLCRESDPVQATRDLLAAYFEHLKTTGKKIELVSPVPIEDESRKLPSTGYFEKTPFYGSRADRQELVKVFIEEMGNAAAKNGWKFFCWPKAWYETDGVDFMNTYMERPRSVHLARKWYRWDLVNDQPNPLLETVSVPMTRALLEF